MLVRNTAVGRATRSDAAPGGINLRQISAGQFSAQAAAIFPQQLINDRLLTGVHIAHQNAHAIGDCRHSRRSCHHVVRSNLEGRLVVAVSDQPAGGDKGGKGQKGKGDKSKKGEMSKKDK